MTAWCDVDQVNKRLASVEGKNYTPDDVLLRIEDATLTIKTDLGVVLTKTQLDAWDAALTAVPPAIQMLCAGLAAANVLQDFVQLNSIADPQSKAGGLFKSYKDLRDSILRNKGIITTSDTDNTSITTTAATLISSTYSQLPVFSRSFNGEGSLDNY